MQSFDSFPKAGPIESRALGDARRSEQVSLNPSALIQFQAAQPRSQIVEHNR